MCVLLIDRSEEEEGIGESILEGVEMVVLAPPMEPTVRGLLTPLLLLTGVLGLRPPLDLLCAVWMSEGKGPGEAAAGNGDCGFWVLVSSPANLISVASCIRK